MVETRPRRWVTAESEAQAVQRVLEGGSGLSEVAAEPGQAQPRSVSLYPEGGSTLKAGLP